MLEMDMTMKKATQNKKLELPVLNHIEIQDHYWNKYITLVTDVIIPYQWAILNDQLENIETSHCIENFKIAAGQSEGEFYGAVFQDTDVAKWLEAAAYTLAYKPDPALEERIDQVVALIEAAQWEDGYINTYYTIKAPDLRFTNLQEGHELYTAGHLMEAAVAYYKVTGKDRFLNIMMRFADLICEVFGDQGNRAYPGHQEIELALIKLYEVTGKEAYLNMANAFIARRGQGSNYFLEEEQGEEFVRIFPEFKDYDPAYSQSHLPVIDQKTAEGHAVRATYMYCAMADLAYYKEDQAMLESCKTLWHNMTEKRMYVTGGIGSSGLLERFTTDYDLPNDDNYSETCASIGLALFGRRMSAITKDATYYDAVEKALYNVVLAGIAMDGKSFFYVNPLEVWPNNCLDRTSKEHVKPVRQEWFGVACCPPNINRTLASLGEYIYYTCEDRVYINLFVANKSQLTLDAGSISLDMKTNFPFEDTVTIEVTSDMATNQLAVRIPDYVQGYEVLVDGNQQEGLVVEKGYLYLDQLDSQVRIDIKWHLKPRLVYANPNVREDIGKVAIMKGPVVYCLEEVDNGPLLAGIYLDSETILEEVFELDLLGGTSTIGFDAYKVEAQSQEAGLYSSQKPIWKKIRCKAVPYPYWGNRQTGEMLVWMKHLVSPKA